MGNNADKRKAALEHNANRVDMASPIMPNEFPPDVRCDDHGDMLEFTRFDTTLMTFTKRFDSIINKTKHHTLHQQNVPMDIYNNMTEQLIRDAARNEFKRISKATLIH
jgi:hypothetical protein